MRRANIVALAIALTVGVGCLGAGCSKFDDPSTVKDLRILAVRAEPPVSPVMNVMVAKSRPGDERYDDRRGKLLLFGTHVTSHVSLLCI